MNRYIRDADDFYVNVHLNTEMDLPSGRDTVLHFFEQMKKGFPERATFTRGRTETLSSRGIRTKKCIAGWRLSHAGCARGTRIPNRWKRPIASMSWSWSWAPPLLTISLLDCEALDVMYGFDFNFDGNHDEVVAEALGVGSGLEGLFEVPRARVVNYEPSVTFALNESCQLQCRLAIETRTNATQGRTRDYGEDQLSVYFTVRQYWGSGPELTFLESFRRQREVGEEILHQAVIPRIVRPLAQVIASR